MKNVFFFLLLLVTICSYAQESQILKFSLEGNELNSSDNFNKLKLPLEIEFTKNFKDYSICILNSSDEVMALKDGKFGAGQLSLLDDNFVIEIDKEGRVNPTTEGDKKIEGKIIKLKIGNLTPIALSFDDGKINIIDDNNTSSNDNYQPGYIYYDAIKLSDSKVDKSIKKKILISYGYTDFKDTISNLYLKKLIKNVNEMKAIQGSNIGFGSLLTNLGNADVTYIISALSRIFAEMAKEEINETFLYRMKEKLNAYPELNTIFPNSSSFLDIIETYSISNDIKALKDAFETDIQNLPINLYNVKDLSSVNCDVSKLKEHELKNCQERMDQLSSFFNSRAGRWIGLGMFTVKEAVQTSNPANLLKSITESEELKGIKKISKDSLYADYNIVSSIELSNFISQSLISKDENQVWITSKEFNTLITNEDAFKIYLGLLLSFEQRNDASNKKINFYKTDSLNKSIISFGEILIQTHNSIDKVKSLIKNTYTAFNTANNAVKKIFSASDRSLEADPKALYDYYRTFTSSLKVIITNPFLKENIRKDLGERYAKVELILNPAVDIAYSISAKRYSSAVYNTTLLLNNIESNSFEKPVIKSFVKYGTLISTVANAQSSDEVKHAMEASILPIGSSAIKRNSSWSISINGYVGAYWSYANKKDDTHPKLGLSSPIGFNISKGFSANGNCGGVSLNLQILDIGSLVNYYLIKGDTASIQNNFSVKLSNIFAPGFNLCYNIPKTPLSIAWGGQYIPTLYRYEQINGKNDLTPTNTWRWQLSLLIDIPLFNLKVWDFK